LFSYKQLHLLAPTNQTNNYRLTIIPNLIGKVHPRQPWKAGDPKSPGLAMAYNVSGI